MQKNVIENGIVTSPVNQIWAPEEIQGGSFYSHLLKKVHKIIEEEGDWLWLHNRISNEKLMASEFEILSKKFAVIFKSLKLEPGDVVHLIVGNHNYFYPALGGIWILGGIASLGDSILDSNTIANQLIETKAKLVICVEDTANNAKEAIATVENETNQTVHLFSLGVVTGVENILARFDITNENKAPEPFQAQDPKTETCVIFWTSGTTGSPKGICHSHFGQQNFFSLAKTQVMSKDRNNPVMQTTSFFHVGGFNTPIIALEKRQTDNHLFGKGFSNKLLLEVIVELKPVNLALGAHNIVQLAELDILDKVDPAELDSVKMLLPSGSAVPPSCVEVLKKKFRNLIGVGNMYAQSESGMISAGFSISNLGMVWPHVKVKIEDPETGNLCGPNEEGEICAKTPYMMLRYLNKPKETQEYFDKDGFGHTGDLGFYNDEGFVVYVDRMKDLIKYNNIHVAPMEIENLLQKHEAVVDCVVYGTKDPNVQELISAVVVKNPKINVTEDELIDYVNSQVSDFKQIRGGITFQDEIQRNSTGKLQRRSTRKWAEKHGKKSSKIAKT